MKRSESFQNRDMGHKRTLGQKLRDSLVISLITIIEKPIGTREGTLREASAKYDNIIIKDAGFVTEVIEHTATGKKVVRTIRSSDGYVPVEIDGEVYWVLHMNH